MSWWKMFLMCLGLVFLVLLGFTVIGFLYSIIWYLFWFGVIAVGGYAGYKMLKKGDKLEIEGYDSVSNIELDNAKAVKELEDYKTKVRR